MGAISIHAPARGATRNKMKQIEFANISIHAPARFLGVDYPFDACLDNPARGATSSQSRLSAFRRYFNPRSREGSDLRSQYATILRLQFQSTLPRGERLLQDSVKQRTILISIHAPARGATLEMLVPKVKAKISIHAPARGATEADHGLMQQLSISIHAPARGAT